MENFLLNLCLGFTIFTFLLCIYACARIGRHEKVVSGLEWEQITQLTGEVASVKRSILSLSNRINGMNKGSLIRDLELHQEAQINKEILQNGKGSGG